MQLLLHACLTTWLLCCADSERMQEGDEELSEEALPQLPASVHVRKSSVACSKVSGPNAPPPETLPR